MGAWGRTLERQAHGKVERKVAAEVRVEDGVMLVIALIGRIDGLHSAIKTENEVIEVESQAKSIRISYLLVELIPLELSAWLVGIVAERPDVSGINERRAVELPKEMGTKLNVEVELHVARLIDEVNAPVGASELSRAELPHAPSSHRVGSA